jgi:hypothetical protein
MGNRIWIGGLYAKSNIGEHPTINKKRPNFK